MIEFDLNSIPTVVDVTLYRYNYVDNKFYTELRNQVDYKEIDENSILVSANQIKALLKENYSSEILRLRSNGYESLHKDATSIHFLQTLIDEFYNLKYIKVTVNKDKSYSRIIEETEQAGTLIKFNFKVLHGTIRLYNAYRFEDLLELNRELVKAGILKNKPYCRITTVELLRKLELRVGLLNNNNKKIALLDYLADSIEPKIEGDNPRLLVITDY
jgi:hypothetical protein